MKLYRQKLFVHFGKADAEIVSHASEIAGKNISRANKKIGGRLSRMKEGSHAAKIANKDTEEEINRHSNYEELIRKAVKSKL